MSGKGKRNLSPGGTPEQPPKKDKGQVSPRPKPLASPPRVKKKAAPKSDTARSKESRDFENQSLARLMAQQSVLVVVDACNLKQPELVLMESQTMKAGVRTLPRPGTVDRNYCGNQKAIAFFEGCKTQSLLSNRDVLQFYGLTVPGVTVVYPPDKRSDGAPLEPTLPEEPTSP